MIKFLKAVLVSFALLPLLSAQAEPLTLGSIAFESCDLPARRGPTYPAQCASVEVAENAAEPQGRRIALAVALLPARARVAKSDVVVFLAGGPGQAARESYGAIAEALEPLRRERHILLIDQRGTGGSNRLACALPDWKDPAEATIAAMREQAELCLKRASTHADPRHYTTSDAVRDLETLRKAIGAPAYNLIGGSYGTRVALEYLRRHPQSVRSVVIDSVAPPELALLQDHARNLDEALAKTFARCQATPSCRERFGDPRETARRLQAQPPQKVKFNDPLTFEPREELFSKEVLSGVVRLFSYSPEASALLPMLLDEAVKGRPQAMIAQAELIFRSLPDELAHGMELSVVCAEDAPFIKPYPADAGTILGNEMNQMLQAQCAVWPRGEMPADFKQPVKSDKPVLLLSGELDPVTPPRYAEQAKAQLSNSRHLVAKGQGHIVSTRGCMPKLLRKFIEKPEPQALDASCLDTLDYVPAFESYQGAAP